jgi:cobalt-zinc-cadmium resistance protein CzcA
MKKEIISNFCLLLTIAIFASNLKAQNRLSLDQALEKAYQNNQLLQANELEWKSAQLKQKSIVALPKTNVNVLMGQMNTIRFDENISLSQDIPNPAYIRAQREAAGQEAVLLKQQIAINKLELGYNLRQSWYQWIYLKELKGVLIREDSLLQSFAQAAAAKYKAGESRLLEKTSAESRRQQLLQSIVQIDMLLQVEQMKMQQYIGLAEPIEPEMTQLSALQFDNSDKEALSKNPMLQYIKQQMAISDANVKVAQTERLPDFNAGYFIQSLGGPQEINGTVRNFNAIPQFQGVSLGINLPIFGGKAYKAKQEVFEIQKSAEAKQSENVQWQLQQQLEQTLSQYSFWLQNLEYYKNTAVPNGESIIQNATKSYRSGEIEYVEYLQALQTGLEIRKGYLEAINNLNQTVLRMEYLVGK